MLSVSVVLHVGLPKTGTTYLQGMLAENRDRLRAQGVLYPHPAPGAHFRGAVEIRGSAAKFGLDPDAVCGTWMALCAEAHRFEGTTILGHEVLAGATPDQIATALAPLAGLDVRIVISARDLGRQATAHWQEEVKLGHAGSFEAFERDQLRADSGRDLGPDAGGLRPHFWHAQDWPDALARWTACLDAGVGHLVVAPAPGSAPQELWRRFCAASGVDDSLVSADGRDRPLNPSLAAPDIALLRAVNLALGDRLRPAERNRIVKREWAERELTMREGERPRTPRSLRPLLTEVTERWVEEIRQAGYAVHGDVCELAPVTGEEGDDPPDVPARDGDDPAAIARSLLARAPKASPPTRRGGRFFRRHR